MKRVEYMDVPPGAIFFTSTDEIEGYTFFNMDHGWALHALPHFGTPGQEYVETSVVYFHANETVWVIVHPERTRGIR